MYVLGAGGHGMQYQGGRAGRQYMYWGHWGRAGGLAPSRAKAAATLFKYIRCSLRIQESAASLLHPRSVERCSAPKAKTTEGCVCTVLACFRVDHFDSADTITYLRLPGFWKVRDTGACSFAKALFKYIDKTTLSATLTNQANSARRHVASLA